MKKVRLETVAALFALALLVGVMWILLNDAGDVDRDNNQEFTELRIVQFYLHLPAEDMIIGRGKTESFAELLNLMQQTVLNIENTKSGLDTISQQDIDDISQQTVAVSAWLIKAQKISTSIKGTGPDRDKYGNAVISTDRIFVAMGGKHMGAVFTRDPESGLWQGWEADRGTIRKLAETLRTGGL